jgi:Glycosyltransferase Family 4
MRLLYLYPEAWTGHRAREVQVLSTCVSLAQAGIEVTLVTAGGEAEIFQHLLEVAGTLLVPGMRVVALSRTLGPVESTSIFSRNFAHWMKNRRAFDLAFIIHLKAGPTLTHAGIPYVYEAHGIFTPTQPHAGRQRMLHKLEGQVLSAASMLVATSAPLATALTTWFSLGKEFAVVPNAGFPPLDEGISDPSGPFVYCGSIADPNDLAGVFQAAHETKSPLRVIGGNEAEWRLVGDWLDTSEIDWHPHLPLDEFHRNLAGARAGLIATNPDSPAGEFACPLKLFDYAGCGLQVLTTSLPALQSLDVGSWCTQVPSPARLAWIEALQNFRHDSEQVEAARVWSGVHTWAQRAEALVRLFQGELTDDQVVT